MMNLADALDIHARARPDHPAIIENGQVITHAASPIRFAAWRR